MATFSVFNWLIFSTSVFLISLYGVVVSLFFDYFIFLINFELTTLSIILNFIIFSSYFSAVKGQIWAFYLIIISASESALGLSIMYYATNLNEFKPLASVSFDRF